LVDPATTEEVDAALLSKFETLMRAPADQLARWLTPVLELACSQPSDDPIDPLHWIGRWAQLQQTPAEAVDRGVFGFLLMNLLELEPGGLYELVVTTGVDKDDDAGNDSWRMVFFRNENA